MLKLILLTIFPSLTEGLSLATEALAFGFKVLIVACNRLLGLSAGTVVLQLVLQRFLIVVVNCCDGVVVVLIDVVVDEPPLLSPPPQEARKKVAETDRITRG